MSHDYQALRSRKRIPVVNERSVAGGMVFFSCVLSLAGCASMNAAMGTGVRLDNIQIVSMAAELSRGTAISPGEKVPLIVTIQQANGQALRTEGAGAGDVRWQDLRVTTMLVTVDVDGIVALNQDARVSDGKRARVTVTIPNHPGIKAELDIPVDYKRAFVFDFTGIAGTNGADGLNGFAGLKGSPGSTDPNYPVAGGHGTNGTDGSDGEDGGPGGNAPGIQIQVTLRKTTPRLLQILVAAAGRTRHFLIDPNGGSLTVKADGGRGGSGGLAGRGGIGGRGGTGIPIGSDGTDGADGQPGSPGPRGAGGAITLIYDPSAKLYLSIIHLSSTNGPTPVRKEQSVSPLW